MVTRKKGKIEKGKVEKKLNRLSKIWDESE